MAEPDTISRGNRETGCHHQMIISMDKNEFYIGWNAEAPGGFAKHVRKVVIVLFLVMLGTAVILSLQQRKFSTSSFEFGQLTEVTGIFQQMPVPAIKVVTGQDLFGRSSCITIPLVGYGKFGAEGVIAELEQEKKIILDKKEITLRGTLLYSDGKTLLQIDKNDEPLVKINEPASKTYSSVIKELGSVQLSGEVLDPKCYFGVMKPGSGKPHRDCAIRCTAGGISPVFWVQGENGETNYYLILDADGKKMNDTLKDFIGEPVTLSAKAVRHDDWIVLYTDKESIRRIKGLNWSKQQDETISCGPDNASR